MESIAIPTVSELFVHYLMTLDSGALNAEKARELFTDDIVIEFPMSRHEGIAGIDAYHADAVSRFAATQHLASFPLVRTDGVSADLEAHVVSIHVHRDPAPGAAPRFTAGTRATAGARRTGAGWRLCRLGFQVVWIEGSPTGGR
jgi:hypothetical protein